MPLRDYISTFSPPPDGGPAEFPPYMRAWFFEDDAPSLLDDFPNPPHYFPDKVT